MPRFSRGSINTTYFHVMTQGINKSYIFDKPEDIKYYIKIMYELKEEHNIKIIAYCIMNNHTHMLIHVEKIEELSKYMQSLNIKYGIYYNIYENPVKAGICCKPEQYPYSNYKAYPDEMIDDKYSFLDIEEEKEIDYLNEIEKFLKDKNIKFEELNDNNKELEILVKKIRNKYKISLRKISEILNIGREKIRILYKK